MTTLASAERPLDKIMESLPEGLASRVTDPKHEVQVLYLQIDRDEANEPYFTQHGWRVNEERYFYPASTVKFPLALLALEQLAELNVPDLDRNTTMLTDASQSWQTSRHVDKRSPNGLPSIGNDARKIFLVSENDAFNRLFEFVGIENLHRRLEEIGLAKTRIVHRLAVPREPHHSRFANPIRFLNQDGDLLHALGERLSKDSYYHGQRVLKGKGVWRNGEVLAQPMDFSDNSFFPLTEQQQLLRTLIFPRSVSKDQRIALTEDDRLWVLRCMNRFPREDEIYAKESIKDTYVKRFLSWHELPIRSTLRCFNKSGEAYGYLTDNAYIIDAEHGVEFFLAAVIHVNANEIYNDDVYEYEQIGYPFFAALGRAVYEYEKQRARKHRPEFGELGSVTQSIHRHPLGRAGTREAHAV